MPEQISLSLFKRANGVYYILYHDGGRIRWKSTGCTHKPDALRTLAHFDELLKTKPPRKRLAEFSSDFLQYARSCFSPKTAVMYRGVLHRLQAAAGNIPLSHVNARHADAYKAERLRHVSPVSVNVELRTLRAAFSTAVRWGLIERNPFKETSLAAVPQRAPAYFTREDFQRLLAFTPRAALRHVITIAALTGLRRGELVNLQWANVDLQRRLLVIESSPTFHTKAGKRRAVPLNETAHAILAAMNERIQSEYVFTLNGKRLNEEYLTHCFKKIVRAGGLPDTLHLHSLRHSFASHLVQAGVPILTVKELLGHSSVAVTQIYSHIAPSELHGAVEKLPVLN